MGACARLPPRGRGDVPEGRPDTISLRLDPALDGHWAEGYRLTVRGGEWRCAWRGAGLFYGVQIAACSSSRPTSSARPPIGGIPHGSVPAVEIEDMPRFGWRGAHLDVARHFMPKSFIKKFIDLLALHKLNRFHWHLTDDQGWRIEIKRYPRLTEVGAWRE